MSDSDNGHVPADDPRVAALVPLGLSTIHTSPDPKRLPRVLRPREVIVAIGGNRIQLRGTGKKRTGEVAPRGRIGGFSSSSRKGLMRKLASIDQAAAGLPLFVTLTYPGAWDADPKTWKRQLDTFTKRLRRAYPGCWGVWRLEPQKRGAPHYHLLLWGIPELPKEWLSRSWFEVVASGDERHLRAGTQVQRVRDWRGVTSYVSKYMAKVADAIPPGWANVGRWWGVLNRKAMPVVMVQLELNEDAWFRLRRWVERLSCGSNRDRSRRRQWMAQQGFWPYSRTGLTNPGAQAFVSSGAATRLIALAVEDGRRRRCR